MGGSGTRLLLSRSLPPEVVPQPQRNHIPLKHRLENPGVVPLELIEVQSGSYLGEDDIVRFEDVYGRG